MRRRRYPLTRQVSLFPVLMLVDEDDATGRVTFHPLPLDLQGRLGLKWLALLVLGWLDDLGRRLTQHPWRVRASLEIGIALILGRRLGLAIVGR